MKKYWLITDAVADQVTDKTGLPAHNTPLGALVERPEPFDLGAAMDRLDRAMYPNKPRCTCGSYTVMHSPRCPMAYTTP